MPDILLRNESNTQRIISAKSIYFIQAGHRKPDVTKSERGLLTVQQTNNQEARCCDKEEQLYSESQASKKMANWSPRVPLYWGLDASLFYRIARAMR